MQAATAAYLEAEDALSAWMEEECERDANARERTGTLFASWRAWAERSGEHVGDTKRFKDRLEVRGIFAKREPGTRRAGFEGLKLKPPETDNTNAYRNK